MLTISVVWIGVSAGVVKATYSRWSPCEQGKDRLHLDLSKHPPPGQVGPTIGVVLIVVSSVKSQPCECDEAEILHY